MFTGLVEAVGKIVDVNVESHTESLVVRAPELLDDARPGDSMAVNGACLTITRLDGETFAVGVVPETLRRTSLGDLQPGQGVNLERPLRADGRLGGHFVQGHVDGTGTVAHARDDGSALDIRIETVPEIMRYVVEKGFIAVDGASLTVTHVDEAGFSISLIPYSQVHLANRVRTPGNRVNLEVDILAKYLEKLVIH
jgi:riboflavin synthase